MERCFQRLKTISDGRFWSGLVGSASRGEDFRRGKRQPRASKNRAKSSDDGRQELGKSWARSGPASSTPHPASRGRRIRQGASHQPGPAPDARSDGRASEEANSWGPFDSFRGAWVFLGRLGLSWGRLGGSWGRLGGSWGRLGGSWAARSKKVSVHLFILAYFCLHFGTFLEDLEGLETTLKGIKTREDKKSQ